MRIETRHDGTAEIALYRKKKLQPAEPWTRATDMRGVSISDPDHEAGSPKRGDMIAHNPDNPADRWLIAADFFAANYELADELADEAAKPNVKGACDGT